MSERIEDRLDRRGGLVEALRVPALLYEGIVRVRRALYDSGLAASRRVDATVVSVGNLTSGGTGKTPLCAWLAHELARRGRRVGFLSRGYGAAPGSPSDEARLLARLCPGIPHEQDKDRVRGAEALRARGVDTIVLDDGFQHRRLARDLDLVLVDATRPFGLAHGPAALLPRGLLREPVSSLERAGAIVLTRCDRLGANEVSGLEARLQALAPGTLIVRSVHRSLRLRDENGAEHPLARLRGACVRLVSALGNPEAFEASVRALGAIVDSHERFPDHHAYSTAEAARLGADPGMLVTSAKDAVKLASLGVHYLALEIDVEIQEGRAAFDALLDALPRRSPVTPVP